ESLNHTKWECKYHVVFIPKCRRKTLYKELRRYLGEVFRRLAEQKESRIEEGHLMPDHVHMMIAIPPKYAVSQVIGYIKGRGRFTWHGFMERGSGILWVSISGPEGTSCRRWGGMRLWCESTSGSRSKRTSGWISWACGNDWPPLRWRNPSGVALATLKSRFERLTI